MDLIRLVVLLIVVGMLLWLINSYLPMAPRIKQILNIVVILAVILWLLSAFGILRGLPGFSVGRLDVPPPAAQLPVIARVYRGKWIEIKGSRQSDFELDLTKVPGTLIVHEAVPQCKNVSIGIFSRDRDNMDLETMQVRSGCERSFALKVSDSGRRLTGTMKYDNSEWDVRAESR